MSDEIMENEGVEPTVVEATEQATESKSFSQEDLERIVEQRLARERKKYEKKLEGVDLEEARRLLEEKEAAEIERQKERGEFEAILKKTAEKKDQQISTLTQRLHEIQIDGALLNAASRNNAVNPDQVVSLIKSHTRLAEDGSVEILDKDGTVRYNESGTPMTSDELVSEFLTANPHFVRASSGGTGSVGAAGGSTQKPLSVADMVANWDNGGRQAFAAMKGKR